MANSPLTRANSNGGTVFAGLTALSWNVTLIISFVPGARSRAPMVGGSYSRRLNGRKRDPGALDRHASSESLLDTGEWWAINSTYVLVAVWRPRESSIQ